MLSCDPASQYCSARKYARGSGDEPQDLRQVAQAFHLVAAAGRTLALAAAQLLQHGHGALRLARHAELAKPRQLHHLTRGHRAQHRVTSVATGRECRQNRADVVLQEQHRRDHDIAARDVGVALGQRGPVVAPFVGGVDGQFKSRKFPLQRLASARHRTREMAVHGHDDHTHRFHAGLLDCCYIRCFHVSGQNGLWLRKSYRS
jgi:hypothetical protein